MALIVRRSAVAVAVLMALSLSSPATHGQGAASAPYMGQERPGATPRVFAPGLVSTGNLHGRLAISPDGREMLWTTVDMATFATRVLYSREVGGRWTRPEPPSFAREGDLQGPMFSPDGRRIYFSVRHDQRWATRFVERAGEGWGAARADGPLLDCSSSFARSGRVYFSSAMSSKIWNTGIVSATFGPGGYTDITPLDATINVPGAIDYTPYVSPDESFLLFSSNRPLLGDKEDMHVVVSFKTADGRWGPAIRVSDIPGRFPSLTADGRYLFFCGDDGNIYWMDAGLLQTLRPGVVQ
jgi:hypothetical protein